MDAVSFIIGHELGHIKRNHMGFLKSKFIIPGMLIPFLSSAYSRAREYTCDNIGYNLCPEGALKGLLILATGEKLYKNVNVNELIMNSSNNLGFAGWLFEVFSTHPALVKRIVVINRLNANNIKYDHSTYISPKIDFKNIEL